MFREMLHSLCVLGFDKISQIEGTEAPTIDCHCGRVFKAMGGGDVCECGCEYQTNASGTGKVSSCKDASEKAKTGTET
jgi:hypothetical protein